MSCQSKGSNVVGLDERGIKQVAQRDLVAWLKSYVVLPGADECLRWNGDDLIEIAAFLFRPIEHDRGRSDLCQAANLAFIFGFLILQNVARLRIDNDEGLRRSGWSDSACEYGKRGENGCKSVRKNHGAMNGSTLIGAVRLATVNPVPQVR